MPGDVEVSIVPFIEIFSTFQKLRTIFFLFSIVEDGHANRKRLVLRCMDTFRVVYLARSQELWQGSVPWAPLLPWNKGHRPICHPTCGHISVITWRLLTYTLRNPWVQRGQVPLCSGIRPSISTERCHHQFRCRGFKLRRGRDRDTSQIRTARILNRRTRTGLIWSPKTAVFTFLGQSLDHPWQIKAGYTMTWNTTKAMFTIYRKTIFRCLLTGRTIERENRRDT